jgi:hypothetical protein
MMKLRAAFWNFANGPKNCAKDVKNKIIIIIKLRHATHLWLREKILPYFPFPVKLQPIYTSLYPTRLLFLSIAVANPNF